MRVKRARLACRSERLIRIDVISIENRGFVAFSNRFASISSVVHKVFVETII